MLDPLKSLARWLAHTLVFFGAARVARFAAAVTQARSTAAATPVPQFEGGRRKLLLIGDSVGVGIGAAGPDGTLAGQLAAEFAGFGVECEAASGARACDLPAQLQRAAQRRYAAIIVSIGGNDIVHATPVDDFGRQLSRALALCRRRSHHVIVANCANLGGAPLFFWPWSRWLDRRSLRIRETMARHCAVHHAQFVNFCLEPERDIFRRHPERYFGADGIHPSPYAYRLAYLHLTQTTQLRRRLRPREFA